MAAVNNKHITTTKRLVPQLRFKEFKGEWDRLKFGKHTVSISSGKSSTKETGEYPVYGSTGVISTTNSYTHEGENILVARVGANAGLINKVSGKYGVTDNTLVIILKNSLEVSFCEYALLNFNLNRLIFGSGQPLVTGGLLKAIKLPFPSLPEQQKIAQFLTAVDSKLQQLNQKKELLEQYKKGVMQQLFSQQLRFKKDDGSDYPDWEEKRLGDLTTIIAGGTPSTRNSNYWNGEIRWMNSGELNLKRVFDVENRITENGLNNSSTKLIPKFSILIGLAGQGKTRGTVAMNMVSLCTNQSIASIFPNDKKFDSEFMYQNLDSRYDEIRRMSTGDGGRGGLNLKIIKSIKIGLPSVKEQQKIANYLSAIDTKIETVTQQIEATQQFKKGVLQQMFV